MTPVHREYRRGDYAGVADLWRRNPSEEAPLLGLNPEAVGEQLRRGEGPGFRFVIGLARALGRPLIIVLITEQDAKVAGSTMLTFTPTAGYVSGVVVDAAIRRQGHARAMVRTCDELCRRYHKGHMVLDVLAQNLPAIKLYEQTGYALLRENYWFARSVGVEVPGPEPSGDGTIRAFHPRDGKNLARLDNAQMPDEVRGIVPRRAQDYVFPAILKSVMKAESEAWVIEEGGVATGFARAVVSPIMDAANLTPTLLPLNGRPSSSQTLIATALRWIRAQGASRVVTDLPQHRIATRTVLESMGFAEQFQLHTLAKKL